MKAAAVLWLPALCLGEMPRASLLQLGSLSKSARGASLATSGAGEARGFTSTLAGFQKYTDQLVDTFMKTGISPGDDNTTPGSSEQNQREIIALIVNYINVDMFNALWTLHEADQEEVLDCQSKITEAELGNLLFYDSACTGTPDGGSKESHCGISTFGTPLVDGQTGETTMWSKRDQAAHKREVHKECVRIKSEKDQENDRDCRRYNKYRGVSVRPQDTSDTDAGANQLPGYIHEDANEEFMTYAEMTSMCITFNQYAGSTWFEANCCTAQTTPRADYCPQAGDAITERETTANVDFAKPDGSTTHYVVTGTSLPSSKSGEKHSVYPSCATKAGSLWIALQKSLGGVSSHSFLDEDHDSDSLNDYRVDGRVWKNKYWVEGDLSSPMIRSEDKEARKTMETCLEAVNLWFHPLYHYYLKCNADSQHTDFKDCLIEQNEYEAMMCDWRTDENTRCDDYDDCTARAATACAAGESICTAVESKIMARKADYETGQRIVCLLDVLIGVVGEEGGVGGVDGVAGNATNADYTEATRFAKKREYLESCKNKKTNNNDDVNRYYKRKVEQDGLVATSTINVYGGTYDLQAKDMDIKEECMTRRCGYASLSSITGSVTDATDVLHSDGTDFGVRSSDTSVLDSDLASQNATRRTASALHPTNGGATTTEALCSIDTEQWELLVPCGSNPPSSIKYPYTFCKVVGATNMAGSGTRDGSATVELPIPLWTGAFNTGVKSAYPTRYLDYTTATNINRWAPTEGDIPKYYVEVHNTIDDDFKVPCSADFFLDDHWGYVDSGSACTSADSEICAGTRFEPTLSLPDTTAGGSLGGDALDATNDQGVPLHLKLYPRKQIMQKDVSGVYIPSASNGGSKTYKHIEVPTEYRTASLPSSAISNAVWYAFFGTSDATHNTVEERSKDQSSSYDAISSPSPSPANLVFKAATESETLVSSVSTTYAGVFEIYASTGAGSNGETHFQRPSSGNPAVAKQQVTAYPDHFSYGWCVKCHGGQSAPNRYILKKRSLTDPQPTWFQGDDALGANFAGNCEAATLANAAACDAACETSLAQGTGVKGQTVVRRLDSDANALEDMRKYMPAYHPHACRLHSDFTA